MHSLPDATWITGIGALTPVGTSFAETSARLIAGETGIRTVENFSVAEHPCQVAGQVTRIPCPAGIAPDAFVALPPLDQCVHWCTRQALQEAGLESAGSLPSASCWAWAPNGR